MGRVIEALKPCGNCGTPMSRKRYGKQLEDLSAFNKRKSCSLSCANTRKILTKHGYSWRARKHLKTLCEACGEQRRLQAHHVDQDKTNNQPTNIQTLCKWCHGFLHATAKRIGAPIAGRMACLALQAVSPLGWTALERWAMPASRKSSKRSGAPSSKRTKPHD
jgi:hypothetical protein